jgi:hypothetical protein
MFDLIRQQQRIEALTARVNALATIVSVRWAEGQDVGTAMDEELKARAELILLRARFDVKVPRA